jgi:CheY-like chemotaxis protein
MTDLQFILVDDDPISNMISKLTVEKVLGEVEINVFTNANHALAFIETDNSISSSKRIILLLDINMPIITGWEFLEKFQKLSQHIKETITIYMLTSSLDSRDKERSKDNPDVRGHLVKPLTADIIKSLLTTPQ